MADPKIFHLLHMSHRAVFRAADRVLAARFGITAGQHGLLLYLHKNAGVALGAAAAALGLRNASASGLVDRMEAKGLIRREVSAADRRACALYLTDAGADIVAATGPLIRETNEQLLAGYDEQARHQIGDFLETVISRADDFDATRFTDTGPGSGSRQGGLEK
ncbi:MAG: MarR family transcriptional regulator [Alphaproteobacteria bacterium]|nr:MAG: MarR family transcriptional regulator [Alphaproteobacteria bacterium]